MTYGLTADCHFHNWSAFSKQDAEGINTRLKQMLEEFERLCSMTAISGGRSLYIAGDIFHVRGTLKTSVFNPVTSHFINCAEKYSLKIYLMPGNHDLEGAEVTWAGTSVIGMSHDPEHDAQSVEIILETKIIHEDKVVVVPWQNTREGLTHEIKNVIEDLKIDREDRAEYDLILHTGINGVITGMPDHAWNPEDLAAFGFKRVFSGHYHDHKVFSLPVPGTMTEETQVVSIGSLTHQSWRDVGTKSGWIIVTDTGFDHHEAATPKFMDFGSASDVDEYLGNYVRVKGIEMDEKELIDLRDALESAGALGVVVHATPKTKVTSRGTASGKSVKMEESITTWIEASDDIDDDEEKEVGIAALDVLSEARSI